MRYRTTAVQNEEYCALTVNANSGYSCNITGEGEGQGEEKRSTFHKKMHHIKSNGES